VYEAMKYMDAHVEKKPLPVSLKGPPRVRIHVAMNHRRTKVIA
jgi:hypothetical protein